MIQLFKQYLYALNNPYIEDLQLILWFLIKNTVCYDQHSCWSPGQFIHLDNGVSLGMSKHNIAMLQMPTYELRLENQSVTLYQLRQPYGPIAPQDETYHKILSSFFLAIPEQYLIGPHLYNKAQQFKYKFAKYSDKWTQINPANSVSSWEVGISASGIPTYRNTYVVVQLMPNNHFKVRYRLGSPYCFDTSILLDKLAQALPEFTEIPKACHILLQKFAERDQINIRQPLLALKKITCQKRLKSM